MRDVLDRVIDEIMLDIIIVFRKYLSNVFIYFMIRVLADEYVNNDSGVLCKITCARAHSR